MTRKVVVVALDGATFDLVGPWAAQGRLPALQRLMVGGTSAPLLSTVPPVTACAWTAFLTGCNPGRTGIYEFFARRDPGSYKIYPIDRTLGLQPSLAATLSQHGVTVGQLHFPMTYPAEHMRGFVVAAPVPDKSSPHFTFPSDLLEQIGLSREEYVIHPFKDPGARRRLAALDEGSLDSILHWVRNQARCTLKLATELEWDVLMVHVWATDTVQHVYWKAMIEGRKGKWSERLQSAILQVFREADELIAALCELAGPDALVGVVSDHGFGANHHTFWVNRWLAQQGFLCFRDLLGEDALCVLLDRLWRRWRQRDTGHALRALKRLIRSVARLAPVSFRRALYCSIQRLTQGHPKWSQRTSPLNSERFEYRVDWNRTVAYSFGNHGEIYINLKGREPRGIVELGGEYQTTRERIAEALLELTDDKGDPVFAAVKRQEELYWGEAMESAPDLVPLTHDRHSCYYNPNFGTGGVLTPPAPNRSGVHRPEGVLILHGPDVSIGQRVAAAHITDVAPTILGWMGLPIPENMDGAVLRGFLPVLPPVTLAEPATQPPDEPEDFAGYTSEEAQLVSQRLRDLGYVE